MNRTGFAATTALCIVAGCGHKMTMPSESLRCTPLILADAGRSKIIRRTARLAGPREAHVSYSARTLFDGDHHLALAYGVETPFGRGAGATTARRVAVWDLRTGEMLVCVEPHSPYPEEVSDWPVPVGLFASADILVTDREAVIEVWRISTGERLASIPFATQSPFTRLERTERGYWSYDRQSSPEPLDVQLIDGGTHLSAALWNRAARVTWSLTDGHEISARPEAVSPWVSPQRSCGDVELTENLILRRPNGDKRLFPWAAFVSHSWSPVFSSDCGLVAIGFQQPPYFFDLNPDLTPRHVRIFDTLSAQLVSWAIEPDGRALAFLPDSALLMASAGNTVIVIDTMLRREVARVPIPPSMHSLRSFGDGRWLLVWGDDAAEVWRAGDEPTGAPSGVE